jgi:hypothetical protein
MQVHTPGEVADFDGRRGAQDYFSKRPVGAESRPEGEDHA